MKIISSLAVFLSASSLVSSLSIRGSIYDPSRQRRDAVAELNKAPLSERFNEQLLNYLEKRKGGGGGSRGGGGSSSSSSSSSSSGSSGSSGSSRSGSGSSGSRNTGTASSSSSINPSYGGGRYYGGGATSAYRSGGRSPRGIAPYALAGLGLGIFPGLWLYGAYAYNYDHPYRFHNASNTTDPKNNETLPVTCLCDKYSACGCDDNNNSTYLNDVLGNGSMADMNSSLVHVSNVNGSKTVVLNGTLPNGTDDSASSGAYRQTFIEMSGLWVVAAIVAATVMV